jgi:hypothetical protein
LKCLQVFLQVFPMHISSVSFLFLYVASVASKYFKSSSRCCICEHDIRGTSGIGRGKDLHGGEWGAEGMSRCEWHARFVLLRRDKHARSNRFFRCRPVSLNEWNHRLDAASGRVLAPDIRALAVLFPYSLEEPKTYTPALFTCTPIPFRRSIVHTRLSKRYNHHVRLPRAALPSPILFMAVMSVLMPAYKNTIHLFQIAITFKSCIYFKFLLHRCILCDETNKTIP